MKFTLSWLKDHLDTDADLDTILENLTDLGLEVEEVIDPAATLGAFSICRIIEAVQHPDADRLRLCRVEAWPNGPDKPSTEVQVVCGAPNARTGLVGVFAAVGTHVPGTGVDLKAGVIRGVESNGMLCSERELMISEDHDGIIDLPADTPLGVRYIDFADLNDPVIDIAITPNRPDALGVRGVARDLAARGIGTLKPMPTQVVEGKFKSSISVSLYEDVKDSACPFFAGRMIKGVKNGPSPAWLQQRLRGIGLRPINCLVDITNYITYDRARPLHVFDVAKVTGNIHVRLSKQGEELVALDGKSYSFDDTMTLVCDDAGAEAIGGVMGGEASGCSDETTDVFIESAYFDPIRTAITGRKLKINSDARYRFERGIDPAFTQSGIELATKMILDLCGGEPSDVITAGAVPNTGRSFVLRENRVESLVGMVIEKAEQQRILETLGFEVTDTDAGFDVSVPSWRPDVHGEADLVEEIARVASLTKLESKPLGRPSAGVMKPVLTTAQKRVGAARRALAASGLNEAVCYTFVSHDAAVAFGGGQDTKILANPISSEMSDMRPSLLPGLLEAAARNQARGFDSINLFEIGPEFQGGEPGEQRDVAAGIRAGSNGPKDWTGSKRIFDLFDAKADAEAALSAVGAPVENLGVFRDVPEWWHPGRAARLSLGPKNTLAIFGELHPKIISQFDLKGPVVGFEVFLENIPHPKKKSATRAALNLSDYQAVDRDFAFVIDQDVEAEKLIRAARGADKKLIDGVTVFDVFEGEQAQAAMGEGKKSVAISVRLQPSDATLTDKDIEQVSDKIIAMIQKSTGGFLRK